MTVAPRVIAIIAAYNEEDIIESCITHLAAQGVESYLLDDGSTDATVERAQALNGRGLIGLERLTLPPNPSFSLTRILQRKERLARDLPGDWFINQDADEFRDSPWPDLTLQQAFERVSRMGYNAVDFEISTMLPADAMPVEARDSDWWVPADPCDRLQVRAWSAPGKEVAMVESAGHDVCFEGRRVFPLRFPLRHYPMRGREHAEGKVRDRMARFDSAERAKGWHVQYDQPIDMRTLAALARPYDATDARIRAVLANRDLEQLRRERDERAADVDSLRQQLEREREQAAGDRRRAAEDRRDAAVRAEAARAEIEGLRAAVEAVRQQALDAQRGYDASLDSVRGELASVLDSRSWRWTAWVRKLLAACGYR